MIEVLLKELKDQWGYTTEELNDIRDKLVEFGESCYHAGYNDASSDTGEYSCDFIYGVNNTYGKKSDND